MTTFSVVGSGNAYGDPAQVTRGSGATSGNLLIAIVNDRSGTSHTNHTVTDSTSNSGDWTKRVGYDNALANSGARISFSVWSRVANGDDSSSFTVTADDGTANSKALLFLEIQPSAAYGFEFQVQAAAGSGTGHADGLSSGSTSDPGGSDLFELAVGACRNDVETTTAQSFAAQTDGNTAVNRALFQIAQCAAIEAAGQASGAKSATYNFTVPGGSPSLHEGVCAVLVFSAGAAGGETLTAESGSYTLTGQAAGLLTNKLGAESGSYALTGQDAGLSKSGAGGPLHDLLDAASTWAWTRLGPDTTAQPNRLDSATDLAPRTREFFAKDGASSTAPFADDSAVESVCQDMQDHMDTWNGAAVGLINGVPKHWSWGVGHTDGAINQVIEMDLDEAADRIDQSTGEGLFKAITDQNPLHGSASGDYPARGTTDSYYYWPTQSGQENLQSVGSKGPPSGHSYDWMHYDDSRNALWVIVVATFHASGVHAGIWYLDFDTGEWVIHDTQSPTGANNGGGLLMIPDGSQPDYLFWKAGGESAGVIRYDIANKTFSTAAIFWVGSGTGVNAPGFLIPSRAGGSEWDWVTVANSGSNLTIYPQIIGGTSNQSYGVSTYAGDTRAFNSGWGFRYRPEDGLVYAISSTGQVQTLSFSGSPGSVTCTVADVSTTGNNSLTQSNGVNGKMNYLPALDCFTLIVGDNEADVFIAKPASWNPDVSTPDPTITAESGTYALTGQTVGLLHGRRLAAESGNYALSGQAAGLLAGQRLSAETGSYTISGQGAGLLAGRLLEALPGNYVLTGQTASLLRGLLLAAETGSYTLSGQDVSLLRGYGLLAESGSYALSGQNAGLRVDRRLDAETGSYALTGQDAVLSTQGLLTADAGQYLITGQAVNLLAGRRIVAESGLYLTSGQEAALLTGRRLEAESGGYVLVGQDAGLAISGGLLAEAGAYTLTGQAANLLRGLRLVVDTGTYALTGQNAELIAGLRLLAATGAYTLSGQDVELARPQRLLADPGAYVLSGQDADLLAARRIAAEAGLYVLTGQDAELLFGLRLSAESGLYALEGQDTGLLLSRVLSAEAGLYAMTGQSAGLVYSGASVDYARLLMRHADRLLMRHADRLMIRRL